ncbi:MAG: phosphoglycerate kinase [Myxococcota bacterium]|nr:phosphoglycerate kinase [Myxococcota bacterium]
MKTLPSIRDVQLEGRPVFMRVDFNVPVEDGKITSDARIRAALPSIKHALGAGAKLALASHFGRPKGKRNKEFSLELVGDRLSELLGKDVVFAEDCVGDGVTGLVRDARAGSVILLENLRFHAQEEENDTDFSKKLAAPFEIYVNDAFGASHRAHASIVGMTHFVKQKCAGFLLEAEVKALGKMLEGAEKPFVAVVGGAKVADKLGVLKALIQRVDVLCIGGAMAYTFLKARGVEVGASKWEGDKLRDATEVMKRAKDRNVKVLLPVDHVVAEVFDENAKATIIADEDIPEGSMGLDIGPESRKRYTEVIDDAKTVFWNGPMGVFEWDKFAKGTNAIAEAVAASNAYTVVGGGDSVAAIEKAGVESRIKHISTGGGASLELLELGTLPGIEALLGKA